MSLKKQHVVCHTLHGYPIEGIEDMAVFQLFSGNKMSGIKKRCPRMHTLLALACRCSRDPLAGVSCGAGNLTANPAGTGVFGFS